MSETVRKRLVNAKSTIFLGLWCLSLVLCGATLCLIFLGGQVKSHEAGLAVPDWPLTYGENPITYSYDKWVGNIFHEHFHRLWAGSVATLTLVFAVLLQFFARKPWLKRVGWLAVLVVLLQATLGGLTVLFKLPVLISSSHALLAQTFFIITVILSCGLWKSWLPGASAVIPAEGRRTPLFRAALILIGLIYVQLFVGALMRHTESGLAIPDFPLNGGQILPRFDGAMMSWINDWRFDNTDALGLDLPEATVGQAVIHFLHRLGAGVVMAAIIALTILSYRRRTQFPRLFRTAGYLWIGVLTQITLGAFTIWTAKSPLITSFHVVTGAALLGLSVVYALRAWSCWEDVPAPVPTRESVRPAPKTRVAPGVNRSTLAAYRELTKPRIVTMVLVTTMLGFAMGRGGLLPLSLLFWTLFGTGLTAAGASALNQYFERDADALMNRTRNRPLPLGQVRPFPALLFGLSLTVVGGGVLWGTVNALSAAVALTSAVLYVGVYTPLKRYSWLNTTIGAIPGALPPMIGWAAVTDQLNLGAWVLFFILFLWQHPHFYSIAWMFRDDYQRGGFKMLPVVKPDGQSTLRQSLGAAILLVPVSLLPTFVRIVGWPYFAGALVCGLWFLYVCVRWRMSESNQDARSVLRASVIYLPLLLLLIFADTMIT